MKILKICLPLALIVAAILVWLGTSRLNAAGDPVQTYSPNRFVLLSAELNVSSLQTMLPNTRKVVIQADSLTGQCWVLELTVPGQGNFQVTSARWRPVMPVQSYTNGN